MVRRGRCWLFFLFLCIFLLPFSIFFSPSLRFYVLLLFSGSGGAASGSIVAVGDGSRRGMVRGEEWFFFLSMQRLQTLFFSSPSSVFVYSCFPSFSLFGLCFSSSLVSSSVLKQIVPFCFSTLLSKISTTPLYFSLLQNLLFVSVFFFKSLSLLKTLCFSSSVLKNQYPSSLLSPHSLVLPLYL